MGAQDTRARSATRRFVPGVFLAHNHIGQTQHMGYAQIVRDTRFFGNFPRRLYISRNQ